MTTFLKVNFESRSITWSPCKIPKQYFAKICLIKFSEYLQSIIIIEQTKKIMKKLAEGLNQPLPVHVGLKVLCLNYM